MDRRRAVLGVACLGGVAALPLAIAQQAGKVWRLGVLSIRARPIDLENDVLYGPFLKGLRELGYIDGKNLLIEWRFAHGQYDLLPSLADELVRMKVDAIAVVNVPVVRAVQNATKTIPIVILSSSDPVRDGFVASLARPGGNITGMSNLSADLSSKYVELISVLVANVSRIAFLSNPANSAHQAIFKKIQTAAEKSGVRTVPVEAGSAVQLETAFSKAANEHVAALIVGNDSLFFELRQRIADLALKYRLPAICPVSAFVVSGGLMSYGYDQSDSYRHAATYVDRIFKGAKPGDLPIESPTTLELLINLKTAKVLGLTIPKELLLRADRLIE